jgi:hypothetical protein
MHLQYVGYTLSPLGEGWGEANPGWARNAINQATDIITTPFSPDNYRNDF